MSQLHYPPFVVNPEIIRSVLTRPTRSIDPSEPRSFAKFKQNFNFTIYQLGLTDFLSGAYPLPDGTFSGVAPNSCNSASLQEEFEAEETITSKKDKKNAAKLAAAGGGSSGTAVLISPSVKKGEDTYSFAEPKEAKAFKEAVMAAYTVLFAACEHDSVYSVANIYGAMDARDPFNSYQALVAEYENSTGLSVVVLFFELLLLCQQLFVLSISELIARIERIRDDLLVRNFEVPEVILVVILMKATTSTSVREALDRSFTAAQLQRRFPNWRDSARTARYIWTNSKDMEIIALKEQSPGLKSPGSKALSNPASLPPPVAAPPVLDARSQWEAAKAAWNSSPEGVADKAKRDAAFGARKQASIAFKQAKSASREPTAEETYQQHYAEWMGRMMSEGTVFVDGEAPSDDDQF
jgi:hypothetical protein